MQAGKVIHLLFKVFSAGILVAVLTAQAAMAQDRRDISLERHLKERGIASYYSNAFNGRPTAAGDIFTNQGMTAASNTLPLGTVVKVTNRRNGKWVVVTINDRMNKHNRRTIDLTKAAAKKLGMLQHGTAYVKVEVVPAVFYKFYHLSPGELVAFGTSGDNDPAGS